MVPEPTTHNPLAETNHRIKAVLFDLGSTLIFFDSTWEAVIGEMDQAMIGILHQAGLTVDRERFITDFRAADTTRWQERNTEFIETSTLTLLQSTLESHGYPEVPEARLREVLAKMYAIPQAHWHVEADAAPTLETLRQEGYRMGIISNAGDDQDVRTLTEQADLTGYFDFILSSAGTGIRKPHPRIFNMALAQWGLAPAQAVMIGDTLDADVLGAHQAGMPGIWISRRVDTPENRTKAEALKPDAVIAALSELPALLHAPNFSHFSK
jgi:HAD superfamily hydrolase (TIGR01549 family)